MPRKAKYILSKKVMLSPENVLMLEELEVQEDLTQSDLMRRAIKHYYQKMTGREAPSK